MKFFDFAETNFSLKEIFAQQEIYHSIYQKIKLFFPPLLRDQFNVVCVHEKVLIIYANSSLIANYLNLKKK